MTSLLDVIRAGEPSITEWLSSKSNYAFSTLGNEIEALDVNGIDAVCIKNFIEVSSSFVWGVACSKGDLCQGDINAQVDCAIKYLRSILIAFVIPSKVDVILPLFAKTLFSTTAYVLCPSAEQGQVPESVRQNADLALLAVQVLGMYTTAVSVQTSDNLKFQNAVVGEATKLCRRIDDGRYTKLMSIIVRAIVSLAKTIVSNPNGKSTLISFVTLLEERVHIALRGVNEAKSNQARVTPLRLVRFYVTQLCELWCLADVAGKTVYDVASHLHSARCVAARDFASLLKTYPLLEKCFVDVVQCNALDAEHRLKLFETCLAIECGGDGSVVDECTSSAITLICILLGNANSLQTLSCDNLLNGVRRLAVLLPSVYVDNSSPHLNLYDRSVLMEQQTPTTALSLGQRVVSAACRAIAVVFARGELADRVNAETLMWQVALDPHYLVSTVGTKLLSFACRNATPSFRSRQRKLVLRTMMGSYVGINDDAISRIVCSLCTSLSKEERIAFQRQLVEQVSSLDDSVHKLQTLRNIVRAHYLPSDLVAKVCRIAWTQTSSDDELIASLRLLHSCVRFNKSIDPAQVNKCVKVGLLQQRSSNSNVRAAATLMLSELLMMAEKQDLSTILKQARNATSAIELCSVASVAQQCGLVKYGGDARLAAPFVENVRLLYAELLKTKEPLVQAVGVRSFVLFAKHTDQSRHLSQLMPPNNRAQIVAYLQGEVAGSQNHQANEIRTTVSWNAEHTAATLNAAIRARKRRVKETKGTAQYAQINVLLRQAVASFRNISRDDENALRRARHDVETWNATMRLLDEAVK